MASSPLNTVIRHLLSDSGPDGGGMTDGELLARFLRSRDDNALAALVRRHALMVWGVCRRLLPNHPDAEDAFQATFLVLVRKAKGVPRHAVASWLYGVARQTAVRLRATAAKRRRRETQVGTMPEPSVEEARDADLTAVLDEELGRLPDNYRGVVVLCDLEGLTRREAARQLGIPEGSVASRLARARVLLARRLAQRGVVVSGGSVAAALSAASALASAPPALVTSTIEAASLLAAGRAAGVISAQVGALTEGVVKAMFVTRIKGVLAVVLVIAALAGAAGLLHQTQAADPPRAKGERPIEKPKDAGQPPARPKPQPDNTDQERMVGNWVIINDASMRKGEMWVFSKDQILMHAKNLGVNANCYAHRLDAGKTPKQIDITVTRVNGPAIGVIKGIYVLDGDELRLCLGEMGKDRPAAFPEKPGPGEVLILQRRTPGTDPKANAGDLKGEPLDKALQLVKDSDADPDEKVHLLAEIGGAQARRGAKKEADKTFQLALGLVQDIKNGISRAGALGSIAYHQLGSDDVKAARKTLAALVELQEKTDDDNVRLNATNGVNGIQASIAAAQARLGEIPDALKTASEIGDGDARRVAYGWIAREQAKRKDFVGAVKTVEQTESVRIPLMLFEIAKLQEKTDKSGADATWQRCAKALQKLELSEETDIIPARGGMNFRDILPALVERGHGAAVQQWIDGLPSVALKVRLMLIMTGND